MILLSDFRAVNPGVAVTDWGGPWLVVFCRGKSCRYDSREEAERAAREECLHCPKGRVNVHEIVELERPPVRKAPGGFRELGWE